MAPLIYLVVLDLAAHHAEGVVARVVVDVDPAEARGASSWDPLPVGIIVDHDGSPGLADALFTVETQQEVRRSEGQDEGRSSTHTHVPTRTHTHSHTHTLLWLQPSPSLSLLL